MAIAAAEALASLGFTNLESQIYAFLLRESPATGYRIAQGIGKPVANTYKAIESLEAKGAVLVEEESGRQCRPVPVDDLLGRMAREFEARKTSAQEALTSLSSRREIEGVFTLRSRQAILDQAKDLLTAAKAQVIVSASGGFATELAEPMKVLRARGAKVSQVEAPDKVDSKVGLVWPGEALILSVDAEQMLQALVDNWGTVVQAVWTRSPFLALVTHQGLACQVGLTEMEEQLAEGAGPKRLNKTLSGFASASGTLGYQKLHDELL